MNPDDLYYSKDHEWVRVEPKKAVVGLTHYAQEQLGDVTFVELPEVGRKVKQFEEFGIVESVKAASDMYSPVSGTLSKVNEALNESPELINDEPYETGWICELRDYDERGLDELMTAEQYEAYLSDL